MIILQFSVEIKASKEAVWFTLWDDKTFCDWANIIDEGTYLKGEFIEGSLVEFISSVNGYGVTSLIEKLIQNEFILFKHNTDTKENGVLERDNEWTGGKESYLLEDKEDNVLLTVSTEVPENLVILFNERLPKALNRIKVLTEENFIRRG